MRSLARISYFSCCALLVAISAWPWVLSERAGTPHHSSIPRVTIPDFVLETASSPLFKEILQRPLFTPSRRDVPVKALLSAPIERAPVVRPEFEGYRLTGMVEIGNRKKILLETPDGQTTELFQGEVIDGWRVEQVSGASVILRKEQWTVDLLNPDLPKSVSQTGSRSNGRNTKWLPKEGQ